MKKHLKVLPYMVGGGFILSVFLPIVTKIFPLSLEIAFYIFIALAVYLGCWRELKLDVEMV